MQIKNKASYLKMDILKIKKPKERIAESSRSTMGYTFLSNINFLINKTQENFYFRNQNSLGYPPSCHPTF